MGKKNDLMVGVDLGGTSMTSVALDGRGRVLGRPSCLFNRPLAAQEKALDGKEK